MFLWSARRTGSDASRRGAGPLQLTSQSPAAAGRPAHSRRQRSGSCAAESEAPASSAAFTLKKVGYNTWSEALPESVKRGLSTKQVLPAPGGSETRPPARRGKAVSDSPLGQRGRPLSVPPVPGILHWPETAKRNRAIFAGEENARENVRDIPTRARRQRRPSSDRAPFSKWKGDCNFHPHCCGASLWQM